MVDEYFPTNSTGELLFAKSNDINEIWVQIVEKAYAKIHHCYF
jgi:hypothetical protein